jgi:O-antigen ligase
LISGTIVLIAGFAGALVLWGILLLLWAGPPTARRRAGVVYALAVAQPLTLLLLSARTVGIDGASSAVSHTGTLVGRAMNLAMLGVSVTLLLFPGERVGRGGRSLLGGVWAMALALAIANAYSPSPGAVRYEFYFAVALTAIVLGVPDRLTFAVWARRTLRLVVLVSLGAAVVAPTWAFIGEGTQGYDRTIFGVPRLTGLSPHPNALSAIAVAALLFEVGFRFGPRGVRVCAGLAAVACLLLTQSNTGYIAATVGILALLAVRRAGGRRVLVAAAIALLGVYVFWPQAIIPGSLRSSDYISSVSGRTTIWRLSLDEWHRHPLTGYGPSMYSPSYLTSHFPANLQVTNGHDQVVQTLADSGLLGLGGLVLVIAATVLCAWRARRVDGGLSLALAAAFCTFGLTETPLRVVDVGALFALATLGISLVGSREAVNVTAGLTAAGRPEMARGEDVSSGLVVRPRLGFD